MSARIAAYVRQRGAQANRAHRPGERTGAALVRTLRRFSILFGVALLAACADEYPQTTFRPVTEYGRKLNGLFENTFIWTMIVLAITWAVLLYVVVRFREKPDSPTPEQIHGSAKLEIAWTIAPAVIVAFIVIPTVKGIFETQAKPADGALVVEVIGHQWWWEFRYPEYGITTANELHLPVGRQVDLKMHSADVIHSFWIPALGGKRDVNPQPATVKGERPRFNHIVFTPEKAGDYPGQCAEFCGASHAVMRTRGEVHEPADFELWVARMKSGQTTAEQQAAPAQVTPAPGAAETAAGQRPQEEEGAQTPAVQQQQQALTGPQAEQQEQRQAQAALAQVPAQAGGPAAASLEAQGKALFTSRACIACHTIAGTTAMGVVGPSLTLVGARKTIGAGALPNTRENIAKWIHDPKAVKPGALMPGTKEGAAGMPPTGLSDQEVDAIAAYLSSLK